MGRKSRNLTLRIRYKDNLGIKSRLVITKGSRSLKCSGKGKILRVEKVSKNELYHTGEYNPMPAKLMAEFKNGKTYSKNGNGNRSVEELLDLVCEKV